jgi:hypothetical protein
MVLKNGTYQRGNFTACKVFCHGNITVISLCIFELTLSLSTIWKCVKLEMIWYMPMDRRTEIIFCCVFCVRTGLWNLLNVDLHRMLSGASSFKFQCPLRSLTSSSSFLRVLIRLPIYSVIQRIFPSITCIVKQLLCMTSTFQFVLLLCDILYICYLRFI